MNIVIRRVNEITGKGIALDVYVNGKLFCKVNPDSEVSFDFDGEKAVVYLKTNWCESNRITVSSDISLRAYARGGLLGATFNSLFKPKSTYVLEKE